MSKKMPEKTVKFCNRSDCKLTSALNPLLCLQLFFGYDYGLYRNSNKFVKISLKILCTIAVVTITAIGLYFEIRNDYSIDSFFVYPMQYFLEAMLIIYVYGDTITLQLNNFCELDQLLKIDDRYYRKVKRGCFVNILTTLTATTTYMVAITLKRRQLKVSCIIMFILDLSIILRISLFDTVRYRTRTLRKIVERYYSNDLKANQYELDPSLHLPIYRKIVEHWDSLKGCIDLSFMVSLGVSLVKLIFILYDIIMATTAYKELYVFPLVISLILALHTAILLCVPGVIGELTDYEVDKLKRILSNKLLDPLDEKEEKKIQKFLQYIEHCSLSYSVWRMIPVNNRLIITLANFCTTTMIIIMQFQTQAKNRIE